MEKLMHLGLTQELWYVGSIIGDFRLPKISNDFSFGQLHPHQPLAF
jgi:hypothetical protein